jgi:hypothetical protein
LRKIPEPGRERKSTGRISPIWPGNRVSLRLMRKLSTGFVLLATALLGPASSGADQTATPDHPSACFFERNFQSWKPGPDARSILIRVDPNRYFRLELSARCPALNWPDARLVTRFRSTGSVCDALDWDLHVSQSPPGGFAMPCIVKRMVPLTPEEAAAIPPKQRP